MSKRKMTRAQAREANGYATAAPAQPGAGAPGPARLLALPTPVPEPLPDPEVGAKAQRRRYGAEYKRSILTQAEKAEEPGAVGALLRREGFYSSHVTLWRRQQRVRYRSVSVRLCWSSRESWGVKERM